MSLQNQSLQGSSSKMCSEPGQRILSIAVRRLHAHPENPNRMSRAAFKKLVRHIETSQQYEPVVVRTHPARKGAYQILNGYHRVRAIRQLGLSHADCIVFRADDDQARVYLLTLNKLCGRDVAILRGRLIERLCERLDSGQLVRLLAESKTAIHTFSRLSQQQRPVIAAEKPAMIPMTFFMNQQEHAEIQKAFEKAGSRILSRRRIDVLMQIARGYLGNDNGRTTNDT